MTEITTGEIIHKSGLPYLPIFFESMREMMLEEARALDDRYVPHRSVGENHSGWDNICLHGVAPEMTEYNDYIEKFGGMSGVPWRWMDIAPKTEEFFRRCFFVGDFYRIRITRLRAGGVVDKHIDTPGRNCLYPINIALNAPLGCSTFMWVKGRLIRIPYDEHPMVMLDIGYPHGVYNNSNEDRYAIIIHYTKQSSIYSWLVKRGYKHLCETNKELVDYCRPEVSNEIAEKDKFFYYSRN